MINKFILTNIATIFFATLTMTSHAEILPVSSLFSRMDTNKDGLINRQEINDKSLLAKEFEKFDKNQDGSLDSSEFEFLIVTANI